MRGLTRSHSSAFPLIYRLQPCIALWLLKKLVPKKDSGKLQKKNQRFFYMSVCRLGAVAVDNDVSDGYDTDATIPYDEEAADYWRYAS